MKLYFIRHGEPDYANDCLTETGRKQAEAASRRLEREGIEEIYASPMGRAAETAAFTAQRLGLGVQTLDLNCSFASIRQTLDGIVDTYLC